MHPYVVGSRWTPSEAHVSTGTPMEHRLRIVLATAIGNARNRKDMPGIGKKAKATRALVLTPSSAIGFAHPCAHVGWQLRRSSTGMLRTASRFTTGSDVKAFMASPRLSNRCREADSVEA